MPSVRAGSRTCGRAGGGGRLRPLHRLGRSVTSSAVSFGFSPACAGLAFFAPPRPGRSGSLRPVWPGPWVPGRCLRPCHAQLPGI